MRFSFGIYPEASAQMAENARVAEECGMTLLRTGDMQATHREAYMSLAAMGASTKTAHLGTGVTNPVTRDPVVTAGALATLSEQTGGRAFLGIGVGDSALHNSGLKPATLKQLEEYVLAVRGLLTEGKARFQGRDLKLTWWNNMHPVPIYISAHGPKGLELAGRIADGVIVGSGFTGPAIDFAHRHIQEGARASGRQLADLEVWYLAYTALDEGDRSAADQFGSILAVAGNLLGKSDTAEKGVPADVAPKLEGAGREVQLRRARSEGDGQPQRQAARRARSVGLPPGALRGGRHE